MSCLRLTIGSNKEIKKAIIPTATFASNLFPATKAISNSLFPINHNGILKPAILILIEEALQIFFLFFFNFTFLNTFLFF